MEPSPFALEAVIQWLQKQAAELESTLVVQARIAVTATETRLLALQPDRSLEIIRY